MKIVCDACSAKYSIADDKVKGKVFKIRCKKCSNIIVVRGNAGAAAEEAAAPQGGQFDQKETRVYDYGGGGDGEGAAAGDDAVWHVVVDQEQIGPITVAEVGARFAAGEIDAETYIWREGFADWLPLAQVPEFAALAAGGSTTAAQGSAGQDAVSSMFGGSNYDDAGTARSDPGDVFAAHAAKASADDGGDEGADELFGQSQKSQKGRAADAGAFGGGGKAAGPAAAASPASLKGQRSENSVLFSLNNLAALASDSPRAAPAASGGSSSSSSSSSSAASSAGGAQHGGGEGSGLIDIRSMASAYLGGGAKVGGALPGGRNVGSIDDLPVFSTAAFSEPAVIIPMAGSGRGNNKMMYGLFAAVALLAIVLVVVVIILLGKKDNTGGGQVAMGGGGSGSEKGPGSEKVGGGDGSGTASGSEPGSGSASGADPGSGSGSGSGSAQTGGDPGSGSAKPPGGDRKPPGSGSSTSGGDRKPPGGGSSRPPGGGSSKPPGGGDKPPPDTGGKCMDEVACLLADKPPACCSRYKGGGGGGGGGGGDKKPPPPGGNANLPEDLQKADISAGIAKVRGRVEGCAAKSNAKGTVKVSVKVAGGGSVSSVTVKESPDPALGSCVAAAIQKATFNKTQNGGSFSYPFTFR